MSAPKSKRGGRRPGAGRPKGSICKSTMAILEAAEAGGETPLEYMLRVMRDASNEDERRDDMAKAAAPYLHAKRVAHGGDDAGPPIVTRIERIVVDPAD